MRIPTWEAPLTSVLVAEPVKARINGPSAVGGTPETGRVRHAGVGAASVSATPASGRWVLELVCSRSDPGRDIDSLFSGVVTPRSLLTPCAGRARLVTKLPAFSRFARRGFRAEGAPG